MAIVPQHAMETARVKGARVKGAISQNVTVVETRGRLSSCGVPVLPYTGSLIVMLPWPSCGFQISLGTL